MALLPHWEPPPHPTTAPPASSAITPFVQAKVSLSLRALPFLSHSWHLLLFMPRLGRNHKGHVYLKTQKNTHVCPCPHTHPPASLPLFSVRGEAGKTEGVLQLGSTLLSLQCLMVRDAEGANFKWLHDFITVRLFFKYTSLPLLSWQGPVIKHICFSIKPWSGSLLRSIKTVPRQDKAKQRVSWSFLLIFNKLWRE